MSSYKVLLIPFMNCLEMEKQYGWLKSLFIIAMCFTDLSGGVNSLCLNLSVGRISISRLLSYCRVVFRQYLWICRLIIAPTYNYLKLQLTWPTWKHFKRPFDALHQRNVANYFSHYFEILNSIHSCSAHQK